MKKKKSKILIEPPKETKIWRYLDISKFIYMLSKKALIFPRVDKFKDPFEGSYSKQHIKIRESYYENITNEDITDFFKKYNKYKAYTFVSCWHMNEFESDAMWKLYLKSNDGVAIQSTYKNLIKALNEAENELEFLVGQVEYIDYDNDFMIDDPNPIFTYYYKRKSFEHERELRAVFTRVPTEMKTFINLVSIKDNLNIFMDHSIDLDNTVEIIPMNLNTLIEKIYVPPTADDWFKEVIESLLEKFGLNINVERSELNKNPIF
ncbi:MAG TPA: hypothetical protein VMY43_10835 [Methanothrix sp.]|nr:hypothetical protein [Methanothrix sp.]